MMCPYRCELLRSSCAPKKCWKNATWDGKFRCNSIIMKAPGIGNPNQFGNPNAKKAPFLVSCGTSTSCVPDRWKWPHAPFTAIAQRVSRRPIGAGSPSVSRPHSSMDGLGVQPYSGTTAVLGRLSKHLRDYALMRRAPHTRWSLSMSSTVKSLSIWSRTQKTCHHTPGGELDQQWGHWWSWRPWSCVHSGTGQTAPRSRKRRRCRCTTVQPGMNIRCGPSTSSGWPWRSCWHTSHGKRSQQKPTTRPWSTHARMLTRCWNKNPGSFGRLPWRRLKCKHVSNCLRPSSSKQLLRERRPKLRVACLRCRHPSTGRCWARSWRTGRLFAEPTRQELATWRKKHVLVGTLVLCCAKLDVFVAEVIQPVNATTRSSSRWRKCLAKGLVLDLLRPSLLANPRRSDLLSQLSLPGRQWGARGPHKGHRPRHRQRRRPKQPQLHLQLRCQPWLPVRKKKLKLRRRTFRFQRHWILGGPTRSSTGWRPSTARQQRARALSTRTGQGASCGWVESQPGTRRIAFQRELPFRLHAWPKPHHPEEEWCSQMPSWSTCVWPMVVRGTETSKKYGPCCATCMQASRPSSTACQGATEQVLEAVCSEHC